ncbi:MAG: GAF domain-containing protein [Bacteroidales bacterium]|nr:GAF domain-containing protein [Bacteroidales bacterium]
MNILETENTQSLRELNIILSISQSIISTLDYQTILQWISNGMSELLEIESAAIYTIESENEIVLGATTPSLDPNFPDELRKAIISDHPIILKTIETGKHIHVSDTRTASLSPSEKNIIEMRNLRSLLYLPFIQETKVIGVLILGTCNKSRSFTEHEINMVQMVANQLSVAIQNSRLHVDLNNYKDNLELLVNERTEELEAANDELQTLNEELQTLNEELSERNNLVVKQKDKLETTLHNLKAVQTQLIQAEKMASLGILTSGVAHEINNPLNFIMGSYYGLINFFETTAPEYLNDITFYLDSLKTGVDRATAIVHGLNQFSRDNKNNDEDCDIHTIIDNCLVMLKSQYKDKMSIDKLYEIDNVIVKGNVGKLHQVFVNLLSNSIQAIDVNGNITIATKRGENSIIVTITDNGCGIDKENLNKIFDPFFTTKDPGKGTGLGLSISYNIIKELNGIIAFESELHEGTKVTLTIPKGR